MSKTFYADGETGKVAIMEGAFSQTVFDNPQANSDKIYFHSDFLYLKHVGDLSGSVSYSAVTAGYYTSSNKIIGTLTASSSDVFLLAPTVDGIKSQGHFLIQTRTDNLYSRYIGFYYGFSGSTLTVYVNEQGYACQNMPAITINCSVSVYSASDIQFNGIDINPDSARFGRFSTDYDYLHIDISGYPLLQDNPYSFAGTNGAPTFAPASTSSIWVNI